MSAKLCLLLAFIPLTLSYSPLRFERERLSDVFRQFRDWQLEHGKVYLSSAEEMNRYFIFQENIQKVNTKNSGRQSETDATFTLTQFADLTVQEFKDTILMTSWSMPKGNNTTHHHKGHQHHKSGSHHQHHDHNQHRNHGNHQHKDHSNHQNNHQHHHKHHYKHPKTPQVVTPRVAAPDAFDWSDEAGVVTSVKNQGMSGTCWAFAGLANVESLYGKKTGKECPDLSTQALNDCDGYADPYNGAVACGPLGATMPAFYIWVINEGGVMTWEDYPYCSGDNECSPCAPEGYSVEWCGQEWPISPCRKHESCQAKYDKSKFVEGLKVKDFVYFESSEENVKNALLETGPLVAGIDATDLQLYSGGVLKADLCSPDNLNHAVLLVGYGQSEEEDFWRAKNSWGKSWGEDGFFRIQRGTGTCGINADTSSAVLE